jgi:hypothetical protein
MVVLQPTSCPATMLEDKPEEETTLKRRPGFPKDLFGTGKASGRGRRHAMPTARSVGQGSNAKEPHPPVQR